MSNLSSNSGICAVRRLPQTPPDPPLPPKIGHFLGFGGVFWPPGYCSKPWGHGRDSRKNGQFRTPNPQKIPPKPEKWTSGGQISLLRMSKLHRQIHLSDTARTPKSGVKTARGGWRPPPPAPPPLAEKPSNLGGTPRGGLSV